MRLFHRARHAKCHSVTALALTFFVFLASNAQSDEVRVINLEGIISVANADYFVRALEEAQDQGADLVVLRLDTPGGLDLAVRDMIKAILASSVPVAVYVAPSGARAASAGTFLMYASHIAAMSPATNIGSSTPVSLSGGEAGKSPKPSWNPMEGKTPEEKKDADKAVPDESEEEQLEEEQPEREVKGTAMERKILNDSVAYIRGLAELRGRNMEFAEKTVREASNLTASEALDQNVVEFIAEDLSDLLSQVDGLTVSVKDRRVTLNTRNAIVTQIDPDWRNELLAILTNPTVALGLITLGVWGLIYEFSNPGSMVGGVAGVICILLGAYGLNMLPINYAGVLLILLGIALMLFEAITPTFGVLLVGGCAAFIFGAIILFGTDMPGLGIHIAAITGFAVATALLCFFVVGAAIKARRSPVVAGAEAMIGAVGIVMGDFHGNGRVRAAGEIWKAKSDRELADGQEVTVTHLNGLTLRVEPKESAQS